MAGLLARNVEVQPLGEINTTPLIDVMLVLLIMFIITIPPQAHRLPMDLPQGPPPQVRMDSLRNQLTVSADGIARWNGSVVGDAALVALFRAVATMDRPAEIQFAPDPAARYERVDAILALAKKADVRTIGFVGNERYRTAF